MVNIQKTTGEKEKFKEGKFMQSMQSAGVDHSLAQEVIRLVVHDKNNLTSTDALHSAAEKALVKKDALASAARYNLKRAIIDLGPSGYPFEQYVARIFNAYGYKTKTNQIVQGKCISHEIDIIAKRDNRHFMIECKHHHYAGAKTKAKVALYIYARFLDVLETWSKQEGTNHDQHVAWLVTNTRASADAIAYAECMGMKVLAWHYPKNKSLNVFIEDKGLYPITVLPRLNKKSKTVLLKNNIILVSDLLEFSPEQLIKLTHLKKEHLIPVLKAARELLTKT